MTPGFRLPADHVIHTVGPVWRGGTAGEAALLASCYRGSLDLALAAGARSIAFPAISTGLYGYPAEAAAGVAAEAVRNWLAETPNAIDLLLFVGFNAAATAVLQRAIDATRA